MIGMKVSFAILAVLAVCVLLGVLRALKKPLSVSICRLVLTLIAVPIAVLLTAVIADPSADSVVNQLGTMDILPDDLLSSGFADYIRVFCAAGIASILFLILFPVINAFLRIPVKPLSRLLDEKILHSPLNAPATENTETETSDNPVETPVKSAESGIHKSVKLILGGVCGLIFAIVMLSPIVGTLRVVGDYASVPAAELAEEDADEAAIAGAIADAGDAPLAKAVWYMGGAPIYKGLSTYSIGDIRMSVCEETALFRDLADYLKEPSQDKGRFSSYSSAIEKSVLVGEILPDVFDALFDRWAAHESYAGIQAPSKKGMSGEILNGGLTEFSGLNRQQMKDSMFALVDLAAYILDNGGIDDLESLFTDEDQLTEIYACLMESEVLHNALRSALDSGLQTMTSKWGGSGIVLANVMPTDADGVRDEARALAHATVSLIRFNDSYSLASGDLEETLYNLGAILDGFKDTDMIGEEQTKELLESALQSESIKEALGYDTARAEQEIENILGQLEEENYADLLSSLAEQVKR